MVLILATEGLLAQLLRGGQGVTRVEICVVFDFALAGLIDASLPDKAHVWEVPLEARAYPN